MKCDCAGGSLRRILYLVHRILSNCHIDLSDFYLLRQYSRNLIFDALDDKKENGFYKSPLPNFDILLELALNSKSRDDMYGAAAMILENFADELLCQCETLINDRSRKKEFKRLVELFKLKSATNRCSVVRKTYEQVKSDYCRWKKISDIANKM